MSQQLAYIKRNYLCYWRKLRKDFPIINNKILKVPFILIMTSSVSSLIFFISYILLEWFNIQFEHILLIFILLVLYIVFKDMKNNIIFLRYSAINGELFFTIPSPWRRIYSSTLIERAIVPYIFIWLTTLVITISTIILAEHSFHLLLNWAFFLSITLLLLFIFKDIISLILLYLSTVLLNKDLNGGLPFLNKAIFYFFASLVTSLMISNIAIYNEPLSFLENIVSIIFSYNTAFKWLSNEIENAINGRINIHNYIRLYILTILMLSIRSIIFLLLDKTNFFPLNKSKQENIIHPIALLLLKLVKPLNHFLFYTLLRKDIIYLSRHTLFQEKFRIFFYTLIIMSGSMTGLLLFIMENPIRLYLTFKCFLFSPPVTTFLILFLGVSLSSVISSFPKQITSFDAEGKNIYWFNSTPVPIIELAKAKITLHYLIITIISSLCVLLLSFFLKLHLIYIFIILLSILIINLVISLINVGSTIIFPYFEWNSINEIGNNTNARLFRLLEYLFMSLLIYGFIFAYYGIKYFKFAISELEIVLIGFLSTNTLTILFSIALWKLIKHKVENQLVKEK